MLEYPEVLNLPTIYTICGEFSEHEVILERLKQAIKTRDFSLLVIFPTLSLLHQIQEELLNEPELNGWGGVRFLLFEGFIKEIGARFGFEQSVPSPLVRDLLITEAFENLKAEGKLTYLARTPFTAGYRKAVLAGIAEWKRSGLTPDIFTGWAADKGGKEQQLAMLYQCYQQLLGQNGFREEDMLLSQLERLTIRPPAVERPLTILYGFTDLTPLQNQFIEVLSFWFDFEIILDPTPVREIRDFITRRFSCGQLPEATPRVAQNALSRLQTWFWCQAPEPRPILPGDDSLQLLQTAGWSRQATAIAWEIMTVLRENPACRLEDFLILSPRPQAFLKVARPAFAEYHLPLPVGTASLGEYPGLNHFCQAMAACDLDWQWPEMEIFIRQQYTGESTAQGDRVLTEMGERYGALSGKERWLSLFKNPDFHSYFLEKGLNLEPLKQGIVFLESIPGTASRKHYLELAHSYFQAALSAAVQRITGSSTDSEQQLENLKAMQQLVQAIDEIMMHIDKLQSFAKEITLTEFRNFWLNYILTLEVKAMPDSGPLIKVLVPQEARGLKAKVVFITGLEQGSFPRNYINDWKLSLQDRRELQALGIELETGQLYQTKEKLAFYWALQTAKERLYLVYQEQDGSGQPLNHSSYLDEIWQWFPELPERAKRYSLALEPPLRLAECYSHFEQGSYLASRLIATTAEMPELEQTSCWQLLQKPDYQQLARQIWQEYRWRTASDDGFLKKRDSKQLVAKIFNADHIFAITALEEYHSCPYRFFLKQLLKVKPLIKPQLLPDNLDLGNLYHHVLQEFTEAFRGQSLSDGHGQEYRQFLGGCFHDFYHEWQQNAANDLIKLVLALQETQIWGTLQRWLSSELDWAIKSNGRFKIRFLEFGFGLARGDFDPASLTKPFQLGDDGTAVKIWGKVDRIDTDAEGNFVVYDYKSGRGPSTSEMLQGDYLQIPLYIMALEELLFGAGKAAGGSYLGLKEPSRSRGGVWHADRLSALLTGKCLLEDTGWRDWLEAVKNLLSDLVRAIRAGEFSPATHKCPPFCEYQSCCRRDEREVEPADEISVESAAS
jgi:ATP-dependent helicase/DNAse subunit B